MFSTLTMKKISPPSIKNPQEYAKPGKREIREATFDVFSHQYRKMALLGVTPNLKYRRQYKLEIIIVDLVLKANNMIFLDTPGYKKDQRS